MPSSLLTRMIAGYVTTRCAQVTYKGDSYPASVAEIGANDPDFMPAGAGQNASNTDQRVFTVTPTDFLAEPVPGEVFGWDSGSYVILAVKTHQYRGEIVMWRCTAYRASLDPVVQDAAQIAAWKRVPKP